jgi:hypothetical protein
VAVAVAVACLEEEEEDEEDEGAVIHSKEFIHSLTMVSR